MSPRTVSLSDGGVEQGHAWLAAVLPADAHRIRAVDPQLRSTLRSAGADLVTDSPDAEIGPVGALLGDARAAIAPIDAAGPEYASSRGRRAARRIGAFAVLRVRTARARRALARRGYPRTHAVYWDYGHRLELPSAGRDGRPTLAERLPQHAVAVAESRPSGPTALDAAIRAVEQTVGKPLRATAPRLGGVLLVPSPDAMLRVAVGAARSYAHATGTARLALTERGAAAGVLAKMPQLLASGRTGLVDWALEERLPGATPSSLSAGLRDECLDFLESLWWSGGEASAESPAVDDANVVAETCAPAAAPVLRALAERIDEIVGELPRGFVHGDFWAQNLLVRGERLAGVVDWEAAGPGRLPLLDLFQLRINAEQPHVDLAWGPTIVRHLLPQARAGGDALTRTFCARIEIAPTREQLTALVAGYWLDRLAYQLGSYAERRRQPTFIAQNVEAVIRPFADALGVPRAGATAHRRR